jgi:translation initiation factor 2A
VFDNQVSDVAWAPTGNDFIVISGKMPAVCTLYTKDGIPKFEFGKLYLNTIRYTPHDDLVLLGGFGSLAGEMQFWVKTDPEWIDLIG